MVSVSHTGPVRRARPRAAAPGRGGVTWVYGPLRPKGEGGGGI